ncbi:MAG: maf-like protein [Benjaminiella poitrasii]|nr:MAG: maf-like protein [Benjaminiella poitrasii]
MKATEVFDRCQEDPQLPKADVVIGADTIVVADDDSVLEKPRDKAHAQEMMDLLNGKTHHVLTGVQIFYKLKGKVERVGFVERTNVTFSTLEPEIIQAYIESGEPFDKAGGYGIQGEASLFVESIQGDYWNVVGLPKNHLFRELTKIAHILSNE